MPGTSGGTRLAVEAARRVRKEFTVNASRLFLVSLLLLLLALPAAAQLNDTYVITAAANADGANRTRWATQFSILNPHLDRTLRVSMTFLPTGGRPSTEMLVDVPANSTFYSDNVLDEVFDEGGTGSLLVATFASDNPTVPDNVLARSFLVTTNTYNDDPSGTYGQTIPGTWTGLLDIDYDGISALANGIRNVTQLNWRTNVGAVNLGRCAVTLRVSVFDGDGNTILNKAPMELPPLGHLQERLPVQVDRGSVEFYVEDPCSADDDLYAVVFPYTSTIDGFSGDPTYQSPTLLASPGDLVTQKALSAGKPVDPTSFGKKIDSKYAAGVRAQAERRGVANLTRGEKGWKIAK